jgi:MurNAc alpha-1-phosphate uridylyltransferase
MRPVTDTVPKTLLEVAGRPFADWQLGWLAAQGVTDVVYCIAHLGEQVRAHVGDGGRWGLRVRYSDEGPQLAGTAGALVRAFRAGLLDEQFLVLYGDSWLDVDVGAVWAAMGRSGQPMLMTAYRNEGRYDRSNTRFTAGTVARYDKSVADPAAAGMHHVDYGLLVMRRQLVSELAAEVGDAPCDLSDLQHRLSMAGRLAGFEAEHRFHEIGSPAGLAALEAHLRAGAPRCPGPGERSG